MTITELYNQLCNKDFQDHQTGNLFFPAYMYMYNPEKEYEVEKEILDIKNRLHRPNNYVLTPTVRTAKNRFYNLKNQPVFSTNECQQFWPSKGQKIGGVHFVRKHHHAAFLRHCPYTSLGI